MVPGLSDSHLHVFIVLLVDVLPLNARFCRFFLSICLVRRTTVHRSLPRCRRIFANGFYSLQTLTEQALWLEKVVDLNQEETEGGGTGA